jgi:DNA polymerase
MSSLPEEIAAIAAKTRAWAQAQAKPGGEQRVRLARPLDASPLPASVQSILSSTNPYQGGPQPQAPWADSLEAFQRQVADCQRCPLGGRRKKLVFGEGNADADLVFVGEAPGGVEDESGRAFQGAAGELLDRMLAAMGFKRSDVYLCNIVKCRPAAGQAPAADEIEACKPYLQQQLGLLKPKAAVAFGALAARSLSAPAGELAQLRGRWVQHGALAVMPTYAPTDLLRDPALKRYVWDDLKLVLRKLHA